MDKPIIASRKPYYAELKAGQTYLWCRCGRSKRQPFCDGSHVGTGFEPIAYVGKCNGEEVLFCGCKQTGDAPFCDGTHANLPGGYKLDDPSSWQNRSVREVSDNVAGLTALDGECYVFSPRGADFETAGAMRFCHVISAPQNARHQFQVFAEVSGGHSPLISLGLSDGIIFIGGGSGEIVIGGRRFLIQATDGVYIRGGEGFRVTPKLGTTLKLYISACPLIDRLSFPADGPTMFDDDQPRRVVSIDPVGRKAMGDRWFQMLVDKSVGSTNAAQFIGHIPLSKAEPHRHLYEESIIVLSGEGMMWTETKKARVAAGDVIFLPRKQIHSLECTTPGGMAVVGVIHPGDNPGINF